MQTTLPLLKDLQTLGTQLQEFIDSVPVGVQCCLKNEQLIVVGEHQADTSLDPQQILKVLEREIQSLQLRFAHHVRLYLKVIGDRYPYASRCFSLHPPAPPANPILCPQTQTTATDHWFVADEELDALLEELVPSAYDQPDFLAHHELTDYRLSDYELTDQLTDQELADHGSATLEDHVPLALLPASHLTDDLAAIAPPTKSTQPSLRPLNGKLVVTAGVTTLGLVSGAYALTRPCVAGVCTELQTAQSLSQQAIQRVQTTPSRASLNAAQQDLGQAIATLETIPVWSTRSPAAHDLIATYESQNRLLEQLLLADNLALAAIQKTQNPPHSLTDWQSIQTLWQSAIKRLEKIPSQSDFYAVAQQRLQDYQDNSALVDERVKQETSAQQSLEVAKQSIQLAETRQQIATSPEHWQLVQASWRVAAERLQAIPDRTAAATEAKRLLAAYQSQFVPTALQQLASTQPALATQSALATQPASATTAVMSALPTVAVPATVAPVLPTMPSSFVSDSPPAIATTPPVVSSPQKNATESVAPLPLSAKATVDGASASNQPNQQISDQITVAIEHACNQQFQACHVRSIGSAIGVELDQNYVRTVEMVRNSGNRDLQTAMYQHQLGLRQTLESIANQYRLPVEVYDPNQVLLARHLPA
jgi:hypothetical protein